MRSLSFIWKIAIAVVSVILLVLVYNFVDDWFSKDDEVRAELNENQAEAAIESGVDTVTTVTNQYEKETIRTDTVRVIQEKVNEATDFDSAHAVGADGLCKNFGVCSEEQLLQSGREGVD